MTPDPTARPDPAQAPLRPAAARTARNRNSRPGSRGGGQIARAAGSVLEDHIRALRRYARALTGNHADADDLVQEALKRALVYLDGERMIDDLRAYLFKILHHARIDAANRRRREGAQIAVEDACLAATGASQAGRLHCREVLAAMQELSEEHREVLLLVGVEGMSYREAAEILDIAIGTVMSRLSRARSALRTLLAIDGQALEGVPV